MIKDTGDDLVLCLNGVNFRFPDIASKETYLKNRMLFPFVRALHYSADISGFFSKDLLETHLY